jgi:hypothetical protein
MSLAAHKQASQPTKECVQRLQREFKEISKNPPDVKKKKKLFSLPSPPHLKKLILSFMKYRVLLLLLNLIIF